MNWTKEQQDAIYKKDSNILVAAAAGSGKTAVLVERIIQRITDKNIPCDIDECFVLFSWARFEEILFPKNEGEFRLHQTFEPLR